MVEYYVTSINRDKFPIQDLNDLELSTLLSDMDNVRITMPYSIEDDITISIEIKDGNIGVYRTYFDLFATGSSINTLMLTERIKSSNKDLSVAIHSVKNVSKYYLGLLYLIRDVLQNKYKNKVITSKAYKTIKVPSLNLVFRVYENCETAYFIYNNSKNVYNILSNHSGKKETFVVPSTYYPLASSEGVSIYTNENTEDLDDNLELSKILDTISFKIGDCHNNSDLIINAINNTDYGKKHKIEKKVGWIFTDSFELCPAVHSWVVIDDKSIIDPNIIQINELQSMQNDSRNGKAVNVDRETLVARVIDKMNDKMLSFAYRFSYGKIPSYCLYVGANGIKGDGGIIRDMVLDKFPNHIAFQTFNKETGNTKFIDLARKKGY